jgi:hypothetical protein
VERRDHGLSFLPRRGSFPERDLGLDRARPAKHRERDVLERLDYYAQNAAFEKLAEMDVEGPRSLTSTFEGRYDEAELSDSGRTVESSSRLAFEVAPGSSHLRLRRLYDQSAIQEAEVFVNGRTAGTWYQPGTNSHHRWAETDFLLPESLTRGEPRLQIEIRPTQPGWNEFRYELWGLR